MDEMEHFLKVQEEAVKVGLVDRQSLTAADLLQPRAKTPKVSLPKVRRVTVAQEEMARFFVGARQVVPVEMAGL